jgi:hypothetical protein
MSIRKWCVGFAMLAASLVVAATASAHGTSGSGTTCRLGNGDGRIKHVIYLQFDNTHFNRDRPNVASDLEQMPHLLNVLRGQGTLFTNDHTILISHTAGGILSSLTGLYPDRTGTTVSNGYGFFKNDGTVGFTSAFKYWTDPVDGPDDPLPNMVSDGQANTPAPWVPYTRAGCDFGGVGTANIELENTTSDITQVFGAGSPEAAEAAADPVKAQADFVGIAIHCAAGGGKCAGDSAAKADPLPDEPGGYTGFQALFGAKSVDPAITGGQPCVQNTEGVNISDKPDGTGNCGFPGFDAMFAKNTLGYVAQMQENGVPVTYGYISDAHDNHVFPPGGTFGPGELGYKAQLKAYDDAFAAFFARLQRDGMNRSNTLLVVTVDEGDHFAGGQGTPQRDGSLAYTHTSCPVLTACPSNQLGEITVGLNGLLPAEAGTFSVHSDDAPTFYVNGDPARTDPAVRKLEHDVFGLSSVDPYAGGATVPLIERMADPVEEKALHMVNTDPARTPTFTAFGNADFFFQTGNPSCGGNPCVSPGFAWNHGDYQHEIANTWVGMVGPGVRDSGIDSRTWTDHTNVRPTILALLGLRDDYGHDGHVVTQALRRGATPDGLVRHRGIARRLAAAYEQLNASFGEFSLDTLQASTNALRATDDATYNDIEDRIAALTDRRNRLAGRIKVELDAAAFSGRALDPARAERQTARAWRLIARAADLAASS